jgi:biopolymer transport protein ExbD
VSITASGKFYLDATPISEASLESGLKSKIKSMGKDVKTTTITVVAEKGTPIESVVTVLDVANRLQLKTILATDPKAMPGK